MTNRLGRIGGEDFDVLIIGGGITGAGIARDAAMRGLRVALVEQNDFASGTSSRSSRLVHGGVRYLEHGQLGLVFESSRERRTLLRIAPHLVRPLPFVWPVYRGARVPRWQLAAAMTLYDALALFRNLGRHQRLAAEDVRTREPRLLSAGLVGGARYWDAATDDARLTLATVVSAMRAGAVVLNHARVDALLREGERVVGARIVDTLRDETAQVRARVVVNATGPWTDRVESMVHPSAESAVRGSKGAHVSVPRSRVGNAFAITLLAPQDGRVMFVLPAGAFTIIGTTDTYDTVSPDDVRASQADVEYLITAVNHYFPEAALTPSDVVSAWAGIRPLAVRAGMHGVAAPGGASREHAIAQSAPGLLRVTGGKLTTYRAMASAVVDAAERALGRRPTLCRTAREPLPGGDVADVARGIEDAARATGDEAVAERLVHAYGSEWREVWSLAENDAPLRERIVPDRPWLFAELRRGVTHEAALTLGDLLIRRIPVAFETADHGYAAARRAAPLVAQWLGWNEKDTRAALDAFDAEAARMFTIEPSPG